MVVGLAVAVAALVGGGAYLLRQRHASPSASVTGRASLRPPPSPAALRTAAPPPRAAPSSVTGSPAARRPAGEPARLRIDADVPAASVFLDHQFVGKTPVELRDVTPGSHRLNVSAEGHEMYAETLEVGAGPRDVRVSFKQVRLDEALDVVHRHGLGSCQGRLSASAAGLQYETERREDAFRRPFAELEPLEVDYLKKNLRVKVRGGKTYNFTSKDGAADALLRFQQKVEAARKRL